MNNIVQMLKDDKKLPDFFKITVHWHDGTKTEFEVVEATYVEKLYNNGVAIVERFDTYRCWTKDNTMLEIPRGNYKCIEYDKDYTKIVESFKNQK